MINSPNDFGIQTTDNLNGHLKAFNLNDQELLRVNKQKHKAHRKNRSSRLSKNFYTHHSNRMEESKFDLQAKTLQTKVSNYKFCPVDPERVMLLKYVHAWNELGLLYQVEGMF